jgi:hypothetical protein
VENFVLSALWPLFHSLWSEAVGAGVAGAAAAAGSAALLTRPGDRERDDDSFQLPFEVERKRAASKSKSAAASAAAAVSSLASHTAVFDASELVDAASASGPAVLERLCFLDSMLRVFLPWARADLLGGSSSGAGIGVGSGGASSVILSSLLHRTGQWVQQVVEVAPQLPTLAERAASSAAAGDRDRDRPFETLTRMMLRLLRLLEEILRYLPPSCLAAMRLDVIRLLSLPWRTSATKTLFASSSPAAPAPAGRKGAAAGAGTGGGAAASSSPFAFPASVSCGCLRLLGLLPAFQSDRELEVLDLALADPDPRVRAAAAAALPPYLARMPSLSAGLGPGAGAGAGSGSSSGTSSGAAQRSKLAAKFLDRLG